MLSLHDKPTMTPKLFNGGFKALHTKTKKRKNKKKTLKFHVFNVEFNPKYSTFMFKEKCPLLSLHEKPTLTPKVLNALQCSTYQKKKALPLNVGFNPTSPK